LKADKSHLRNAACFLLSLEINTMYSVFEMKTPYSAKSIANFFLAKEKMSPMKVQKLVYFAQGWCLALMNAPLIDEKIQAWEYGPVVPSLYREFKAFGTNNIDRMASNADSPKEPDVIALLNKIWDVYGKFSAVQLSNATHESESPWDQVVETCKGKNNGFLLRNQVIENDLIRDFFKTKIA
jgi:uncharacterized phage-associated protein